MAFQPYSNRVIDCKGPFDPSHVKGLSVIVTGGASGMGEQTVRAFVKAGAFVTFGDLAVANGERIVADLTPNAKFFECDVTSFESQLQLFKTAKAGAPSHTIDVVVACAGIAPNDTVHHVEEEDIDPVAPDLLMINVNLVGVLYTLKLARHYFLRNPEGPDRDRCLVLFSSAAGYLDLPGGPMYQASKYAVRGIMRSVRRTTKADGIRANVLAPWCVSTRLLSHSVQDHVKGQGVHFAEAADAASMVVKIAASPSINGRGFAVVPRDEEAPFGYVDQDVDDYNKGSRLGRLEDIMLSTSQLTKVKPEDQ